MTPRLSSSLSVLATDRMRLRHSSDSENEPSCSSSRITPARSAHELSVTVPAMRAFYRSGSEPVHTAEICKMRHFAFPSSRQTHETQRSACSEGHQKGYTGCPRGRDGQRDTVREGNGVARVSASERSAGLKDAGGENGAEGHRGREGESRLWGEGQTGGREEGEDGCIEKSGGASPCPSSSPSVSHAVASPSPSPLRTCGAQRQD
jgi:hypothetical protein